MDNSNILPMDPMFRTCIEAAHAGGDILMKGFRKLHLSQVDLKGIGDWVSQVDIDSEKAIVSLIRSRFPDHVIHAEEGGRTESGSDMEWIIDPLDGTANFVHGIPIFSVSIALVREGEILLGAVYDPAGKELFSACNGGGATLNGEPIRVSSKEASATACWHPDSRGGPRSIWTHTWNHSGIFFCVRRDTKAGFRCAGPGLHGLRPFRRLLGNEAEALGHCCRRADTPRGRRNRHRFQRRGFIHAVRKRGSSEPAHPPGDGGCDGAASVPGGMMRRIEKGVANRNIHSDMMEAALLYLSHIE